MAGKKKQGKEGWVNDIESYSRQIWLAGLGAYAKVGKEGAKLFETLIKDGEEAEKTAKSQIDKQVDSFKGKTKNGKDPVDSTKSKVDKAKNRVTGRWAELEEAFDKRLNNAVARLGVPSRDEIQALDAKVDELSRLIGQMKVGQPQPAKVAAKATPKATASSASTAKPAATPKAAAKPKAPAKPKAAPKPKAAAKPKASSSNAAAKPKPAASPKAKAGAAQNKTAGSDSSSTEKPSSS